MNSEKTEKRTMLITGAAGGIGRATVKVFASEGWRVIGVDRREFGEAFPADGLYILADIADPEQLRQIFERAATFTPTLDALINNAAIQIAKPLIETSVEEWDAVMANNLRSVFLGAKLAFPLLPSAMRDESTGTISVPAREHRGERHGIFRPGRKLHHRKSD